MIRQNQTIQHCGIENTPKRGGCPPQPSPDVCSQPDQQRRREADGNGRSQGHCQPTRPVETAGREVCRREPDGQGGEHGDLSGKALDHNRLSRCQQSCLTARTIGAPSVSDHAAGQRLVHHLRQIVFAQRMSGTERHAKLTGRDPPPYRRQDGLQRQREKRQHKHQEVGIGQPSCCLRAICGVPEQCHQRNRNGHLQDAPDPVGNGNVHSPWRPGSGPEKLSRIRSRIRSMRTGSTSSSGSKPALHPQSATRSTR